MICPWDAGSLQRPSKAPKPRHCYCLWGRPRSLLLRHFRPFWPFASLLVLSHSYCPSLTFCAWRKVIWWEGERTGGQRAARRGKSGGTEESNQINIIILQWLPFTLPVATHIHVWWYLHIHSVFLLFRPKNKCYVFVYALKSNSTYSFLQRILHPWTGPLMFKFENISECNKNSDRKKDINML